MTAADLGPFWLSLRVAGLATVLVAALGTPLAWLLARGRFPGRGLVAGLVTLPLVLPPTVVGYALLVVFGRRGWLGGWLDRALGLSVAFHWSGAVLAAAVMAAPMFLVPARAAFEAVDPELEDAARLLGRGELAVFGSITVPLSWRGVVAGLVLAFARALGEFGATLMLAGNIPGRTRTAPLAIYDAVLADRSALAGGTALLVAATSLLAVLVAQRAGRAR